MAGPVCRRFPSVPAVSDPNCWETLELKELASLSTFRTVLLSVGRQCQKLELWAVLLVAELVCVEHQCVGLARLGGSAPAVANQPSGMVGTGGKLKPRTTAY